MAGWFDGKVALVTGAGSGIGRASAIGFARQGAEVMVSDRDATGAAETVKLIVADGGTAEHRVADVTSEEDVSALVASTVERFGHLDCAHNNAGVVNPVTAFHELTYEAWNHVISVDLSAVFLCMKHEIIQMLTQEGGAIVNTSSGAGFVGVPGMTDYVAAKHGVLGLTKTAAQEYAKHAIRVDAICPGNTDTPMLHSFIGDNDEHRAAMAASVPRGYMAVPDEIAQAAIWLCSPLASYVSGESMAVDAAAISR